MDTFKPTDQQLLDYQKIEAAFKSYPLDEPSEDVLERVRVMARAQVSSRKNVFEFLKSGFYFRQLSWALMIVLVVGLGYTLHQVRDGSSLGTQDVASGHEAKLLDTAKTATAHNGEAESALNIVDNAVSGLQVSDANQKLFHDYEAALTLFRTHHFKEASDLFSSIMASKPAFEKRVELYSYWIQALEELGAIELAHEKREEMKKF